MILQLFVPIMSRVFRTLNVCAEAISYAFASGLVSILTRAGDDVQTFNDLHYET